MTLKREFTPLPPITVDKHKVLQILVNLIRNAKYACDESGRSDKLITLRIESGARGVRISVIDNGVGIRAENMGHLFTHGFTTRQSGHGFGLHSGALAAQQLGGSLRAESEGPESHVGQVVGTVNYMAPEQCGGDVKLTPAADWYAVGVVLYFALCGRLPFEGTATEILMRKQRESPPPPATMVPGIPADLDAL